ncbi:MAG: alpha/beta fold hydrolase, partial [Pseudomonadota bacterium]
TPEPASEPHERWREQPITVAGDLPGLLTVPNGEGPFAVVILVHGSGPADRDQSLGPNKPFRDIAWGLADRGIASLRYDKRSLAQPQTIAGAYTVEDEVLSDVSAAIEWLGEQVVIDSNQLYVAGLSLGGLLAPRIGTAHPSLAGLVLLAAPARGFEVIVPAQLRYIFGLDGVIDAAEAAQLAQVDAQAAAIAHLSDASSSQPGLLGVAESYLIDLRDYDPIQTAQQLAMPMLIVQGGRDYQVTMADDFARWQTAFAQHATVTFRDFPNLNHLFIAGEGMATPDEYLTQSGQVDEALISLIAEWVQQSKPRSRSAGAEHDRL